MNLCCVLCFLLSYSQMLPLRWPLGISTSSCKSVHNNRMGLSTSRRRACPVHALSFRQCHIYDCIAGTSKKNVTQSLDLAQITLGHSQHKRLIFHSGSASQSHGWCHIYMMIKKPILMCLTTNTKHSIRSLPHCMIVSSIPRARKAVSF